MELKLSDVTKKYGAKTAVNHVSLTLTNGIYGLLGENGAGKTTLMRLICDLQSPTGGEILVNGKRIWDMGAKYRSLLGYLPQNFSCYGEFSSEDFLYYMAAVKGIGEREMGKKCRALLEMTGLSKVKRQKAKIFSGGMRQRLGIAQAMLNDPKILILDEPTTGLDPKERIRFRNLISSLGKDRIVMLSTHIVSEVEYIADSIIMMKEGEILHFGTAEEISSEIADLNWDKAGRKGKPTLEDLYLYYFGEGEA